MRRLSLLAAIAAIVGLFASTAVAHKAASPAFAPVAAHVQLASALAAPPFRVEKVGAPIVRHVGLTWKVSLRFSATAPAHASVVVARDASRVQSFAFESGTGIVTIGPFTL